MVLLCKCECIFTYALRQAKPSVRRLSRNRQMLKSIIRKYLDNKLHPNWTIHVGCTDINSLTAPIFTKLKSLKLLCTPPVKYFCHRVKKTQLDAQLILSIFRQPLHVSDVSRSIIRTYNRMYTKNNFCIKLIFLYTIISKWTVNET
jgi:hypothetical protein